MKIFSERVVINLLSNARDAMPNGGLVTLRTGFDPQSQRLTMTVSNTGQGIPEDQQSKIFDPFFTTKKTHHPPFFERTHEKLP